MHTESTESKSSGSLYQPKVAVVGVGNLLRSDDGVGVHLVHKLAEMVHEDYVEFIDAGTVPDVLTLVDERVRKLILVDAANVGGEPGTIYRFGLEDIDACPGVPTSLHDVSLFDNLKLVSAFGKRFESVVIIGIEPETTESGLGLSPRVSAKLPEAASLVLGEIKEFSKTVYGG